MTEPSKPSSSAHLPCASPHPLPHASCPPCETHRSSPPLSCRLVSAPHPPPPNLFTRATSAPRTVPPPLPTIAKLSISQSSSSSFSHASYASSHSRHSSNSNLTSVNENLQSLTDDRLPALSIEESKDILAIEEEADGHSHDEEKTLDPSADADDADEEDDDDEVSDDEHEGEGEGDDYRLSEEEPSSLHINGDLPTSPMSAVSTPLGRAFAIFGREIRHVSPNTSLSLPSAPILGALPPTAFAKRTPRTIPPPLPSLSNGGGRPPATSLTVPSPSNAGIPGDAGSPLSPLQSPLSPVTPSPMSPPPVKAFSPAHSRAPSLPMPLSPTPGAASPPPLPSTPQTRSAASSLTHSAPHPKVRSSLPPGFQFPSHRLAPEAAKAGSSVTSPVMSASSPIQTSTTPASTPPLDLSHSATAPSVLAADPTRPHPTAGSEPTTPRRGQAATMCPPPQVRDPSPEVVRPSTAGARSDDAQGWGRTGTPGLSAIAEGGGAAKQKCIKCVSFSVRGAYCLKHLYYAGLSALAAAPASPAAPLPRLSQTLSPASAASTAQMLRIADELLKTEKSYYESLRVAYKTFQQRLEVAAALAENPQELTSALSSNVGGKGAEARGNAMSFLPVVTSVEIGTMFSKLHDIFTLSSNLYHDLTTLNSIRLHADPTVDDPQGGQGGASLTLLLPFLGSTLLHYSSYFRVYQSYLENYDDAIKTLVQLRSSNVALDVFLTWQEKCEGTSLDSLLIMPVQRLPRYLLLLQEIIKIEEKLIVERRVHPGTLGLFHHYPLAYLDILTAREKISRIADAINSSLHVKESVQVVAHLQSLFEHDTNFVPFATPTRQLVKEGLLKKINETRKNAFLGSSSTYHFFLFNDLFLYAEELRKLGGVVRYRMKYTIPLLDLTLLDGAEGSGKGNQLRLRNEGSGKNLTVQCKSSEERDEWQARIEEMQSKLKELTQSMHVMTFDGNTPQQKKERSNMNKAKMMMGIGAS